MKKVLFTLIILGAGIYSKAQDEQSCYQKYAKVFEVRGTNQIKDGVHKNVIVSIRKGSFADCFMGAVKVKNGNIDVNSIKLTFVDGSYERFERNYKFDDQAFNIINGMSKTMVTRDDELVNIMFIEEIKPKKKALKRAPEPDFDL